MNGVRLVGMFLGFATLGAGGDYAVGLMARETPPPDRMVVVDVRAPGVEVAVSRTAGVSGRCAFQAERRVSLAADVGDFLRLAAGSGELRVEGREGLTEVRAVGVACASDESYLEDLRLTADRRGDEIVLSAHYPERDRRHWRGDDYARLDLTVEIPMGMAADLKDSSGSMEVSGTGALDIHDSSGSISAWAIRGPVTLEDSSGEIELSDVAGDVEIEDGSGGIDVTDVRGSVRVSDGSGGIDVRRVERDVVVERDGSGSIDVRDVRGDFSVLRDGSGGIRHSNVDGEVDVPSKKKDRRRGRRGS